MFKISEFSEKTGFSQRMLRHLEELDLLAPARNEKNYRFYRDEHIPTAIKIKSFQKMGFSLKEIRAILNMDLDQLEHNLEQLFLKKKDENQRIESQLSKIKLVQNAIKNGETSFDFIDGIDEVESDDRAQILLGYQDLVDRVVYGRLPRLEIVVELMFEELKKQGSTYNFGEVNLFKYGEWFKRRPKSYYVIFEIEELVSYIFVAITEDEILKNKKFFNIKSADLYDTKFTSALEKYATNLMENYAKGFEMVYHMPLTFHMKGVTDDKEKISILFAHSEVLLDFGMIKEEKNETLAFTMGLPVAVMKAVDNAVPFELQEPPWVLAKLNLE